MRQAVTTVFRVFARKAESDSWCWYAKQQSQSHFDEIHRLLARREFSEEAGGRLEERLAFADAIAQESAQERYNTVRA